MGYFTVTLNKIVYAQPSELGPQVIRSLETNLRGAVEGQMVDDVGLVVAVTDIPNPHEIDGKILDTGVVSFNVTYEALVFQLFPGEVIDCLVEEVRPEAVIANAGATQVYVSRYQIPSNYQYETDGTNPQFISHDGEKSVAEGRAIRVRIVNASSGGGQQVGCVGTMKGDYLGPLV